jgi:CBS domain-containing protein
MHRFLECTAAQYLTTAVNTVTPQTTLRNLGQLFETHDYNAFPVMTEGRLVGLVTKLDFLRAFAFSPHQMVPHYDTLMEQPVSQVMTEAVIQVDKATPLTRVLRLMVEYKARSLPVVEGRDKLLGIISREDVMRALKETTQGPD